MMKRMAILTLLMGLIHLFAVNSMAQAPSIATDGIRNGASYTIAGLPNSGIAQGSIFVVFGDNLGPANIVQVSSFPLPTTEGLAGTSVRVTVGGTTVNAIMLYTLKAQVAAVLPSNTPLGAGTVTVTFNGANSNAAPITVVRSSFGSFTRNQGGTGPSIVQNFIAQDNQPFNTLVESARPGQVVTLWGTGIGPVTGNEAASPLPGNLTSINARLFVGGREAAIQYRGRSGCCVGIDQIVFTVPADVNGCYVPVSLQTDNVVSNFTSLSVAPNGGACSDPGGFTPAELEAGRLSGTMRIGSVSLAKSNIKQTIPGLGNVEIKSDSGAGAFFTYNFDALLAQSSSASTATPGACSVSTYRISSGGAPPPPVQLVGLNAGAAINVSGPTGAKQMMPTPNFAGFYSGTFSQTIPFGPSEPDYLVPGAYSINNGSGGSGANSVGPFTVNYTVPAGTVWSNEAAVSTVNRAQGQVITWTGGDPSGFTYIAGSSINTANTAGATFICIERTSAGTFTVPASILLALPPSGSTAGVSFGFWIVGAISNPTRFTAAGLDYGAVIYLATSSKSVTFQ